MHFSISSDFTFFRNDCEMTHFFFSLIREPAVLSERTPLMFYFDTHIITQVNLNVKHTFFDKVKPGIGRLGSNFYLTSVVFCWWHAGPLLWTFPRLSPGAALLLSPYVEKINKSKERSEDGRKSFGRTFRKP